MTGVELRTVAELVRLPAALTVPGDVLSGAATAGWPFGRRTAGLAVGSVCLYWAGMALNDFADREVDLRERPERPIPSGRATPQFALGLAAALTATSISVTSAAGGRDALAVEVPLAATVWAYDLRLKATPVGPLIMAAARALDVLLGAGLKRRRACAPAALSVGIHTLLVTLLSRHEVQGASPSLPTLTLATSAGVVASSARVAPLRRARGRGLDTTISAVLLAAYAKTFGSAQLAAIRYPTPRQLQQAVGAGILSLMPLEAALVVRSGSLVAAVPVVVAWPLARHLAKKVSPT